MLKKLFASLTRLFNPEPENKPEATPGQRIYTPPPPVSEQKKPQSRRATDKRSSDKRSSGRDGELLRAKIKHLCDYPIPDADEDSLTQWINAHGLPYDRQSAIRLLAAFGRRLPSSEEVAAMHQSGRLGKNERALLWVRNARERLYALPEGKLLVADSRMPERLALLSVWDHGKAAS